MNKLSDSEIIRGVLEHDEKILLLIYRDNYRAIRKLVRTNSGDDDDVKDVFQDAIIILFNKIKKDELKLHVAFSTYFYSVARNIWLNELKIKNRKASDLQAIDVLDEEIDVHDEMIKAEMHKLVWKHFEKLTKDCQKVIKLILDGQSIAEVTSKMNYSTDQHTKNRRLRCKNTLVNHILNDPAYKELKNEKKLKDETNFRW
jgi:RNA polymerase sigma factor (sigma-70 family)